MSRRSGALRRGLPPAMGVPAPADRRFRRPDVRPAGGGTLRRLPRRLIALAGLAALVAAVLGYGAYALLTSSWFTVRQIVVHGTSRLAPGDVEAMVADLRHDNILLARLDRYRQQVLDSPWIASATLHRQLPATVVVDVTERTPMILAHLSDRLFLVDRTGAIIDETGPQYRDLDLPVVDGLGTPGQPAGSSVDAWKVALVDRFLAALQAAPDLRARVSQIDITDPHDITVLLEGDTTFVRLGDERFVERLRRYLALVPTLRDKLSDLDYVDVRFDNLFVTPRGRVTAVTRPVKTP